MNKKGKSLSYDQSHKIINLKLIVTIVNVGAGEGVIYLIKKHDVSAQFIQRGEGTASRQVLDLLNVEDNRKDIIYSLVREDKVDNILNDINQLIVNSKRIQGISFSIPLETIAGRTAYHFITQTVE